MRTHTFGYLKGYVVCRQSEYLRIYWPSLRAWAYSRCKTKQKTVVVRRAPCHACMWSANEKTNCQLSIHVQVCTCLDNLHFKLIKYKRKLCQSLKLIRNNSSNECPLTELSLSAVQIKLNSVNICFFFTFICSLKNWLGGDISVMIVRPVSKMISTNVI